MKIHSGFRGTFLHTFISKFFGGLKILKIQLGEDPIFDFRIQGEGARRLMKMNDDNNKFENLKRPIDKTIEEAIKVSSAYYPDDK